DVIETPKDFKIEAELPGVKKEDIKLEILNGNTLMISGELKSEKTWEDKGNHDHETPTFWARERMYGIFKRQFPLPENAKVEGKLMCQILLEIKANYSDGILNIEIPKNEEQ
ncbi:HSP20-like chaperone, partial [Rozella allomycis CSF55]